MQVLEILCALEPGMCCASAARRGLAPSRLNRSASMHKYSPEKYYDTSSCLSALVCFFPAMRSCPGACTATRQREVCVDEVPGQNSLHSFSRGKICQWFCSGSYYSDSHTAILGQRQGGSMIAWRTYAILGLLIILGTLPSVLADVYGYRNFRGQHRFSNYSEKIPPRYFSRVAGLQAKSTITRTVVLPPPRRGYPLRHNCPALPPPHRRYLY